MIRVLLDCRMVGYAGVGRYTIGLARALAARDDVELVQVCLHREAIPVGAGDGATSITVKAHPFTIRGAMELSHAATAADPDAVHCCHFPTPLPTRWPLVVTLHDVLPLLVPGVMPSRARRLVYHRWNARATRLADRVLAPTRATAEDIETVFPTTKEKLVVVPEAADDFAREPAAPMVAASVARISSFSPYLLAIGNTRAHKDLPTLLQAFGRLNLRSARVADGAFDPGATPPTGAGSDPATVNEVRLVLVGEEPPGYLARNLAGVPNEILQRVGFTGRIGDPELRTLYSGAAAFVFPSRHEGFGLPPLEAMALGAPVVAADARAVAEVLGDAALFFPAGDADVLAERLALLLAQPQLQDHYRTAGRRRAADFSWARTAEATLEVYHAAIRTATGSGRSGVLKAGRNGSSR